MCKLIRLNDIIWKAGSFGPWNYYWLKNQPREKISMHYTEKSFVGQ